MEIENRRGLVIAAHIADLHFAAFDPKEQYEILKEQFLPVIDKLPRLDIISIDGDIYEHKLMGNSDGLYYASIFVDDVVKIAMRHQATVLIIHGTASHDADQLKNFYHYMSNQDVDVRVITRMQFEMVKGARILCIPELYNVSKEEYDQYLQYSGYYDECFLHGMFQGAVAGASNDDSRKLFKPIDFAMCKGFTIGGHVHIPGSHSGYFYYTGSPYRWKFGEEQAKGFLITVHDLDTQQHYVHFQEIISSSYVTIPLNDIQNTDPKQLIEYINGLKKQQGIDYLKIKMNIPISGADKVIINNYYRNAKYITVEFLDEEEQRRKEIVEEQGLDDTLLFLFDDKMTETEKFVRYVNLQEGFEFITVEKLTEILTEEI